jgi:RNA polymerase sigma-70 factor, ECF subfamily
VDDDEDRERFTGLYDAHRMRVWAFAAGRVGGQAADEVVSETFLVAWRRFADMPEAALPWLLGVARNVIHELNRAQGRQKTLATDLRAWAQTAESDIANGVVDQLAVLSTLSGLSEADREVLLLVTWQSLNVHEAAQVLGCSVPTLRVRLHRARKRFTTALDRASRPRSSRSLEALEWS